MVEPEQQFPTYEDKKLTEITESVREHVAKILKELQEANDKGDRIKLEAFQDLLTEIHDPIQLFPKDLPEDAAQIVSQVAYVMQQSKRLEKCRTNQEYEGDSKVWGELFTELHSLLSDAKEKGLELHAEEARLHILLAINKKVIHRKKTYLDQLNF